MQNFARANSLVLFRSLEIMVSLVRSIHLPKHENEDGDNCD